MNNIICIDFETGGLDPRKNPVTQVALKGFLSTDFSDVCEYTSYVQPYDNLSIEEAALKATGISFSDISKGIDIKDCMKNIVENFDKVKQLSGRNYKPILLGHNIQFDLGFLLYAADKTKTDLSKVLDGKIDHRGNFCPTYIDTLYLSRLMWTNDTSMSKFNLSACCRKAQLEEFDAHSAMNDVIATKDLFIFLLNSMRNLNSENNEEQKETKFRNFFQY